MSCLARLLWVSSPASNDLFHSGAKSARNVYWLQYIHYKRMKLLSIVLWFNQCGLFTWFFNSINSVTMCFQSKLYFKLSGSLQEIYIQSIVLTLSIYRTITTKNDVKKYNIYIIDWSDAVGPVTREWPLNWKEAWRSEQSPPSLSRW